MAVMQSRDTRTFEAGSDLSADQFKFVALAADGQVDLAGSGVDAAGVLLNEPDAAGKAATVVVTGTVMVESAGVITAGDDITVTASGTAEAATGASGDIIKGYALEDAVAGQIFRMELIQGGNAA